MKTGIVVDILKDMIGLIGANDSVHNLCFAVNNIRFEKAYFVH